MFVVFFNSSGIVQLVIVLVIKVCAFILSTLLNSIYNPEWIEFASGNVILRGKYILYGFSVAFPSVITKILTVLLFVNSASQLFFVESGLNLIELATFCITLFVTMHETLAKFKAWLCKSVLPTPLSDAEHTKS